MFDHGPRAMEVEHGGNGQRSSTGPSPHKWVLAVEVESDGLPAGDRTVTEHTETSQAGGHKSVSTAKRERPILDPAAIRTIDPGHALLLLRSAKPIMLTLQPWTGRPDAAQIRTARAEIETTFRAAASQGVSDA